MLAPPRGKDGSSWLKTDSFDDDMTGFCFLSGRGLLASTSLLRLNDGIMRITWGETVKGGLRNHTLSLVYIAVTDIETAECFQGLE